MGVLISHQNGLHKKKKPCSSHAITSVYRTTVNKCLKASLVDPRQSRFVASFGIDAALIEQCWEKIIDECVDFHDNGTFLKVSTYEMQE